ncbi:MAG: KilA-N domain-containing protein [Bacilli bacterium]|nr:KilA-N domain-containing protein [Bacilli bacterium]
MKNEIVKTELNVNENLIGIMRIGGVEYISLTDLAKLKNSEYPNEVIKKWMSNKNSFDFYSLWEELFNSNFNSAESRRIKINEVGLNAFTMSPSQWKRRVNAIGIIPSSGRYSKGTYAHPDIALEFASWIDTSFKLYLIKEFERLKLNEAYQQKIEWNVRRSLSKTNYKIQTESINNNIIPNLTEEQKRYVYVSEADVLNVALFGMTAKEWKQNNPMLEGNIRDNTDILHLIILSNLEVLNSELIEDGLEQSKRLEKLNNVAKRQLELLFNENNIKTKEIS